MIPTKLAIFLSFIIFIYFIIVFNSIRKDKLPIKSSILWILFGFVMIVVVIFPNFLMKIAYIFGIKKLSNLLLFVGIISLLVLVLDLYKIYNKEKRKNIILAQQIGIIKNEIRNKK